MMVLLGVGTEIVVADADARNEGLRTSRAGPGAFYESQRREAHGGEGL
ncbi:hypothetical protein IHO40_03690 [Wolbachia endosymbiont of Mansonella ozzardi]|nr:hypothetical protein [Wolbachia endosymbiont of Mansonella ozzardi]